mmetsp:Transcript_18324/g.2974  ORF Transcript_18324/g.2974 Transcript_18324/m.2974 type:complete len:196 (-) Transcript_18324:500-1087(-)
MILESVATNTRMLTSFSDPVITNLLPVLLEQFSNEDANTRFQYLKIFIDIVIPYLFDESVYDISQTSKPTTKLLNDLIAKKFLPLLPGSLADKDPIPLFALKLVSSLLERCPPFTGVLKRYGVISGIFQNFSAGNARLNAHLIKVVKRVVESKDLSIEEIRDFGIIDKTNTVMASVVRQEWCVDLLLDIIYELLF